MAKVIVTGGSGFIGSHVVDALVDAGHQVTVMDHRVRPHREDVRFEDVDLMDLSSVLGATKGAEHIFHLAAVSNVNYAYNYPVYTVALNILAPLTYWRPRRSTARSGSIWPLLFGSTTEHPTEAPWESLSLSTWTAQVTSIPPPRWPAKWCATTTDNSTTSPLRFCVSESLMGRACGRNY